MVLNKSSHSDHKPDLHHDKKNETEKTSSLKTVFIGNVPSLLTAESAKGMIKATYSWCKLEKNDYWLSDEDSNGSKEVSTTLTTKFKRPNSKPHIDSSVSSLPKDSLFTPTHLESCGLSASVSSQLSTKTFLIVKGTVRTLFDHCTINVLPTPIINGIGSELVSSVVCLVRLASSSSASSTAGKENALIQPVFFSCVDLAFVDHSSSSPASSPSVSSLILFVGLEKDKQTIKLYELSSSFSAATSFSTSASHDNAAKGFIVCKRNISFDDVFLSRIWMNGKFCTAILLYSYSSFFHFLFY
jgi:hypothetical protein